MREVLPPRRVRVLALLLVAVTVPAIGVRPAAADEMAVDDPVRVEADADVTFELDDGRRFLDTLELRTAPDGGVVLVNELGMDDYLAGVSEMPPRWHGEALKAQAVAARTYAWRSILRGTFTERGLGYDICATVACQVFRGTAVVEESPQGERWRAAAHETSNEVLLGDDDLPILARYFSTSGGRTIPNEVAFPDSGPLPYLVGTEDPDDEVSPYHRWEVEFTREEFDDILSRGESLGAAVPVADVERDGELFDPHAEVVVTGRDGTSATVPAVRFREFVSRVAADRHPDRFPGRRFDGAGSLPTTLPSSRFEFEVSDDAVVVAGRGWGHGVGLGQYGAQGKAMRGLDYRQILGEYYNGLAPEAVDDVPERVRVGLDTAGAVTISADAPFRVVAAGGEVVERALGGWGIEQRGAGFVLTPPEERSRALEVSATEVASGLPGGADHVVVEAEVNKPVELFLQVLGPDGDPVLERELGVAEPGTHAATWRYVDAEGDPVVEGDYELALVGVDEEGDRAGAPVSHAVGGGGPEAADDADREGMRSPAVSAAALAAALALVVIVVLVIRGTSRRASTRGPRHRGPSRRST